MLIKCTQKALSISNSVDLVNRNMLVPLSSTKNKYSKIKIKSGKHQKTVSSVNIPLVQTIEIVSRV